MALFVWRGDARPKAQVVHVTAEFVEAGDVCTLTINRKAISFAALSSSVVPIYEGLVAAIEASDVQELADITAEVVSDASPPYLKLTGAGDGRPFTVTAAASNGSLGNVSVATTTSSYAGANEKQQIGMPSGVTGGTFTLSFDGETTGSIAYNASAATVQSALETLANIDSGDVEVSGSSGGPWVVEFKQAYAATDVSLITIDSSSLTAGTVSVVETLKGQGGTNEIIRVTMAKSSSTPSGTPLEYGMAFGSSNYIFRWKDFSELDTAAKFKTAMQEHASINSSNVNVTLVSSSGGFERVYDVEFTGSLGGANWSIMFFDESGYGTGTGLTTLQNGSATGTNEQQLVSLSGSPSGGTFTLGYSGQTTGPIAYNASAATLQTALESLSNIGSGDVVVSGSAPNWTIDFDGDLAAQDVPLLTGNGASLTGGAGSIETTQLAASPVNEKQTVSLSTGVTGGTFTLTYAGQTTGNISYAAAASTVETALEALSNIDAVAVSGSSGGPWIVEFQGSLAATNVASLIGDGGNLTGDDSQTLSITTVTTPTGPHHWSEAANWDQNSVPVTGADVRIENSSSDILYGLDQSAVTLQSLDVRASYSGSIGLPDVNAAGFFEYLPTHLAIGATTVRIGEGEGNGSPQIRLDSGAEQAEITVWGTGSPASSTGYALEWIGTHAANVLTVYKGTVGVAMCGGEVATLDSLDVSFISSRDSDALVYLGDGVTVGSIVKNGGELVIAGRSGGNITSIQSSAGEVQLRGTDGVESLTVEGGDFYYWSTGTLAAGAVISGDGQLIFDGDLRPKTVAGTISVFGDSAGVIDSAEVVNVDGYLSLHFQGTSRFADLGGDIIISRGTAAEGEEEVSVTLYAAAMQMVSVAVDSELESIAAKLATESYSHPSGKLEADIIQIDVIAPTADLSVHDASNDTDGQTVAADATEYFPVAGSAATALRLITETTADVLLKIYYK
ncbi:hypothetical protein LOC68_09890 [Blastopirellula sp. JC732]|uniref:Uncharacterized protein n=1 Tax=Blastopirellula sediminis TaxID=2894196 RepID=A0A9X1SJ68_9BACT|nr:hypothetical protein [Blastopirellula sediminis]MCC9608514.1 hypothetical protein [Blastopirellula sediminis]MCC9628709.1 hypothetical protein [Blastopirellula sediminis]